MFNVLQNDFCFFSKSVKKSRNGWRSSASLNSRNKLNQDPLCWSPATAPSQSDSWMIVFLFSVSHIEFSTQVFWGCRLNVQINSKEEKSSRRHIRGFKRRRQFIGFTSVCLRSPAVNSGRIEDKPNYRKFVTSTSLSTIISLGWEETLVISRRDEPETYVCVCVCGSPPSMGNIWAGSGWLQLL